MGDDRTNLAAKYRRKRSRIPEAVLWPLAIAILAAVVFAAYRLSENAPGQPQPAADAIQGLFDPDRAAIKAWLTENLDNPDFEVVKWHPAVNDPRAPGRGIRLKYRIKALFGNKVLRDEMFYLDDKGDVVDRRTMGSGA